MKNYLIKCAIINPGQEGSWACLQLVEPETEQEESFEASRLLTAAVPQLLGRLVEMATDEDGRRVLQCSIRGVLRRVELWPANDGGITIREIELELADAVFALGAKDGQKLADDLIARVGHGVSLRVEDDGEHIPIVIRVEE